MPIQQKRFQTLFLIEYVSRQGQARRSFAEPVLVISGFCGMRPENRIDGKDVLPGISFSLPETFMESEKNGETSLVFSCKVNSMRRFCIQRCEAKKPIIGIGYSKSSPHQC